MKIALVKKDNTISITQAPTPRIDGESDQEYAERVASKVMATDPRLQGATVIPCPDLEYKYVSSLEVVDGEVVVNSEKETLHEAKIAVEKEAAKIRNTSDVTTAVTNLKSKGVIPQDYKYK